MPVVLQLIDAHKRYGEQALLDGASCALADDQKIGLIGRNGAGKSTVCRLLLGEEELDAGEVVRGRQLRLGYVRQHDPFHAGETVREFLMRDSGQPDWRCGEVAWQFQFPDAMLDRPVRELSGGWQTRTKLAALLLHDPNLLILDEPTNFLDLRTQMLLEWFLRGFRGGCLIVSHDREFLKKTCTHTLELSRGQLTMYPGNVEAYLANVEERLEHDRRVNATTLTKRRQLETFIAKNRAKASTASQAKSKAKQLERLELIHVEGPESTVRFRFPDIEPRQGPAVRTKHLAIGYPDHTVARDVHVELDHGTRVGIVGDNGQGKTTFLRTVCGSLPPIAGEVTWGFGCQVGVYAQHVYSTLPEQKTVLEYLEYQAAPGTVTQQIKDVAGNLLFSGAMVEKRIRVLSGGERARLVLAGLLLQRNNVLVLDEPGNHLDVESVEALAEALHRLQRNGRLHQPRPALHAPGGDARCRGPRRPRGKLPRRLRRIRLPHSERNRFRLACAARNRLDAQPASRRTRGGPQDARPSRPRLAEKTQGGGAENLPLGRGEAVDQREAAQRYTSRRGPAPALGACGANGRTSAPRRGMAGTLLGDGIGLERVRH